MFQSLKGISAFWNENPLILSPEEISFNPSKGYQHFGTANQAFGIDRFLVSIPQRDISILEPKRAG